MSDYDAPGGLAAGDPQLLPPDQMPQVTRELTMLRGAIDAVHRAARDINQKTSTVQHQQAEPDSPQKLSEAFPVSAPLAEELRALSNECAAIEMLLTTATYRIEL